VKKIVFQKYQGTGNDFVMIHTPNWKIELTASDIALLCHRRFGIGADGLILLGEHPEFDFEMRYFNSDGSRSFCGNGARCAVQFAHSLGYFDKDCVFLAIDGVHEASLEADSLVKLKMADVPSLEIDTDNNYIIYTGSPHYICFTNSLDTIDIVDYGKKIRYSSSYKTQGINVNLAQIEGETIRMLTYERGVEDETLSCGTGATAVALAYRHQLGLEGEVITPVFVKGGELRVYSKQKDNGFFDVYLIGPAEKVFEGTI
jgi:diaminopimelate epimerase